MPQKNQIVIVRVADGSMTTLTMPPTDDYGVTPIVSCAKDTGMLLVIHGGRRWRMDARTGERTPLDNDLDWKADDRPGPGVCVVGGMRLERRVTRREQSIVVVPLAGTANPEELSAISERTLVSATNHARGSRYEDGPAVLEARMFTPTFFHYVFTLGDRIYVGNVQTGAYAFVMRGAPLDVPAQ